MTFQPLADNLIPQIYYAEPNSEQLQTLLKQYSSYEQLAGELGPAKCFKFYWYLNKYETSITYASIRAKNSGGVAFFGITGQASVEYINAELYKKLMSSQKQYLSELFTEKKNNGNRTKEKRQQLF